MGFNIHMTFEILFPIFYWGKKGQAKYPPLWLSHFSNSSLVYVPTKDFI